MSSPRHRTGDRRAGGVRSAVYLLCFALVPVFGAAWVGADAWTASHDAAATTRTTGAEVDEFVRLNKLRSALVDERSFAGAVSGVRELGIDPALVRQITGIDIDEKLRDARAAVDALVGSLPLPGVDRDLVGVRSLNLGSVAIGTGYDEVQHALLAKGDLAFASLQHRARTIGADAGGDAIADALDRLDAATRAREAVSSELTSRLATLFGARVGAADATQALIEEHAAYHQAMLTVARTTADGPAPGLLDALAVLRTTGAVVTFERDVEDAIAARLSPAAGSGAGSGIQQEIGAAGEVYRAGLGSADAHLLLIDAAGHDVEAGVRHALDEQSDAARRTMVTLLAGALVLLAFAIAVALSLGRPMRRLADLARAISAGEPVRVERAVGPAEVREATLALDAAAQHLRTVEAQARALARGDLDDEVLQRPTSGALGASLQEAVRTLASSMNEREEFRRRLAHEAATDGLTQLANRSASLHQLHRSLARSRRAESTVALLYLDVDGFKAINDTFGHPAGDAVLRTVAQRLVTRSREGDHVGRLGGDEFVVIAEPVSGIDEARALAERLLAAIEEPVELEHQRVRVSASIGIALGDRADLTADELLRDADLAVYEAKANGRGRVELCNDELRSELAAQFDLDQALRAAVAQGELVVHYQPIVQTTSGEVLGLEALVRWQRPGYGLLAPAEFIPFAERSDLIVDIDRWVVDAVVAQLAGWRGASPWGDCSVSVNLSGRSLGHPGIVDDVLGPLRTRGVDASRLIVEVTESALLDDLGVAAQRLEELRAHGVRTAIDDFGTGYTSLAHLKTLPIDILKIDRSFTTDPTCRSLVKLIIDTGHLLGATVVAEGIETAEQARELERLGTDELQGYLFGRPAPPADLGATSTRDQRRS